MRRCLKQLKPDRIEDLIAMNALYRPGPMQYIESYIARKHGKENVSYPHPAVEDTLKETYGIAVYQEQVMLLAQKLAGYSLGEADVLRRAIGKKDADKMAQQRDIFIERAMKQDLSKKLATEVFDIIEEFAGYGFNKSHSAAYAILAYQTAYLKAHYPVEFLAANLTFAKETSDIEKLLSECKNFGIEVLPPDVDASYSNFTVENGKIRFGFSKIKNLGSVAADSIIATRKALGGKFESVFQFVMEVDNSVIKRNSFQSLVESGAFDSFGFERNTLFASAEFLQQWRNESKHKKEALLQSLFGEGNSDSDKATPTLPEVPVWSQLDKLKHERDILGIYISGHPLDHYSDEIGAFSSCAIADCPKKGDGKTVSIIGLLSEFSVASKNKNGQPNQTGIGALQDTTSQIKVLIWSNVLDKSYAYLIKDTVVWIEGKLKADNDSFVLIADKILPVSEVRRKMCGAVHIKISIDENEKKLEKIIKILKKNHGGIQTKIHIVDTQKTYRATSREYLTDGSNQMLSELREVIGKDNIWISK
jgi:DNA polymerase III subunit alpha